MTDRPPTFGDPARELRAALETCAVFDRSDLGRLRATGRDVLDLLHRLSTADLRGLLPGHGRPTVLTSAKGRIVARLFVHNLGDDGVLLVAGPGLGQAVMAHVNRFTFGEDIGLRDESESTRQIVLVGPTARAAVAGAGFALPEPMGSTTATMEGVAALVVAQDGFGPDGVSVIAPTGGEARLLDALRASAAEQGGRPAGTVALEAWRILRGHPAAGRELTPDRNPLEAGLVDAISFTKGCYVGQEVVARLRTYDRVSRALVGLVLAVGTEPPDTPVLLFRDGRPVGDATSAILPPGRGAPVALAFVRRDSASEGTSLRVGAPDSAVEARVASIPFAATP